MKELIADKKFVTLCVAVCLSITLEILSLTGFKIPFPLSSILYALLILGIGNKVLLNGIRSLIKLQFSSINLLMLIAVVAAFYLGEYSEAAVVIILYSLGEKLEDIGISQSKKALNELVEKSPKVAKIKGQSKFVKVQDVFVGSIIQVMPHEMIPLDGKVCGGESSVDESSITGESMAKDKTVSDLVFAGTLNQWGVLEIMVTKRSVDSTFAKIAQLTFQATANKSNAQKFIQKFARIYTPVILALSFLIFIIPVVFLGKDLQVWLNQSITLLVIACPCALVISTPVAIYAAIGNASRRGALIKGGKFIELIGEVKAVAMDKTRTLTTGNLKVSEVIPFKNVALNDLISCTAGIEKFSEHPIAQAVVSYCEQAKLETHIVSNFKSIVGKGAIAMCNTCNRSIRVGKIEFISENTQVDNQVLNTVLKLTGQGKSVIVVRFGDEVAGIFGVQDEIKLESKSAVIHLTSLNVQSIMLTGDNELAAMFIGNQVGVSEVHSNLLPADKSKHIEDLLSRYDKVAMVGDGINDAPALALSTVGISMGAAGSDTAIEVSDIALLNDDLTMIPFLIKLGRRAKQTIRLNTIGAISIKLVFIILAFLGMSNLVIAISADVGVTLIVILISLQLSKFNG
jgi:Cd2+/Zn2+-exporting ATPase